MLNPIHFVTLAALITGAYYDIKTKTKNIPIWLFPITTGIVTVYVLTEQPYELQEHVTAFAVMLIVMFTFAFMTKFGGADAMAFALIGMTTGFYAFYIAMGAFTLSIPHSIFLYKKKKPYPFLPYIATSYTIYLMLARSF